MFDFIFGIIYMPIAIVIGCILIGALIEHNKDYYEPNGFVIILSIISWVGFYYMATSLSNTTGYSILQLIAGSVLGYFVIGVLWSFWRYGKHVRQHSRKYDDDLVEVNKNNTTYEKWMSKVEPSNTWHIIVYWIVIWPISLLENITHDVIDLITHVVKVVLKSIYTGIFDIARK